MTQTWETLTVETDGAIATVTLTGREGRRGNLMGAQMWRDIPDAMAYVASQEGMRAVILRGSGENFTYGLDFHDVDPAVAGILRGRTPGAAARTQLMRVIKDMQRATESIIATPLPVIAAIDGWCIGGGVDVISAADIRIATTRAVFSVREVRVGMVADMGTLARLPLIVGDARTREWALTGRDVPAAEAQAAGLVSQVVEPAELDAAVAALAGQIAANPPLAVQGVKQVLNAGAAAQVAASNHLVQVWNAAFMPSEDLTEAITAMLERRPAQFTGN